MSTYEAWRATHQDADAAAKAAFEQVQGLAKLVDGLQAVLGRQVRFGSEAGKPEIRNRERRTKCPQQPEALRLADCLEGNATTPWKRGESATELRRLHAENQDLRTRHYCNTAEIESLQARVQELGEMARENRSKRVIELEQRIAELESEAEQNAKIIGASAETELALRGRAEELERKLASIGAGGVEPLRKLAAAPQVVQAVTMPAAQGLDEQTNRDAVIQHLTNAGVLEHDGCGIFIASGDASELIDACMALSTHAHHEKGAAAQAVALLATGGQAQADAQDTDRWMEIGKAIERACADLPEETGIIVSLEKDAGTVTLIDQDGNEHENFSWDYGFAGVMNEAIDTALAAQAKQGEQ